MSEITKPIALDESLHTTEQTPRNLADVLSDELQNLATAISGGSDKVPKTDIATVEPTNTASRAYSIGELVYVNGTLYEVKTAIAIGATFTVGTNIQSTTVSGTVKDALDSFEFGNQSTSGNDRTITLAHDYSAMTACLIQPISDAYSSNYTVKLPITFTAPRTVSFKIASPDGSVAGAAIVCGFMFAGTRD